jgi:Ni,Fe-hydrogenase I small subunit
MPEIKDMGCFKAKKFGEPIISIYTKQAEGAEARLAVHMIERWGCVAAVDGGEDSAGRQKIALMSPEELVSRACQTAEIAYREFQKRGWLLEVPSPEEFFTQDE